MSDWHGIQVTPRQLWHSCAALLLDAGAPFLAVHTILGHKHIDTTLGYARLYDGTLAADYYRAMAEIERCQPSSENQLSIIGQLLAHVDALKVGTLNDSRREILRAMRMAILDLADRGAQLGSLGLENYDS